MGKRKSSRKKSSGERKSPNRKVLKTGGAFIAIILMVLVGVYQYTKPSGEAENASPETT